MLKGSRFIWFHWSQCLAAEWTEDKEYYIFSGKISAFRYLNKRGMHKRIVKISKKENLWLVKDEVEYLDAYTKSQIWHYDNATINFTTKNKNHLNAESFNSSFYGHKEVGKAIAIPFNKEVETKIEYST
jgi:hypothetical protein